MTEEWLAENLNKFEYEEVKELDSLASKIRYSVTGSFILMLFPQYTLLDRIMKNNPGKKNAKVLFLMGVLVVLPITTSQLVSYPFKVSQLEYIEKLKAKYSQTT